MKNNPIPFTGSEIVSLGGKMTVGLTELGTQLHITQVTAAAMQADLDGFIAAENDFNSARSARLAAYAAFHLQDDALYAWLGKVRGVLTGFFGFRWSNQWAQAGYTTPSTATPRTIEGRIGLALRLIAFFTANPSYEAPSVGVTAAAGTAARTAVVDSQAAAVAADGALKAKGDSRASAKAELVTLMRMLIQILGGLLEANDPRWMAFGLNMPSADTTPGKPVNVAAEVMPDFTIMVQCDPVPLATRYRWRMKVVGVDTEFGLGASTSAPLAVISSVDPGQTVELYVQAVNGSAQGVPSETVTVTLWNATAAAPAAGAPSVEPVAKAAGNGNGNGKGSRNGNGHGRRRLSHARSK